MSFIEQLKKNIKNNKRGFSLLELVLAVAIFSFSSFALATMIIDANISTRLSADRTEALLYAKEGIEAVRSIRDNDWATWVVAEDGEHGLLIDEASSTWIFDGSSDIINDKYTRTITLAPNLDVATSRDVSVNISWDLTPGRIASTTLSTVFSNWPDVINSPFVIPRGLVSYWSFDDAGASTALDSVGGNDGTVTGAIATTSVRGIPNQAYSFNGSSDYIVTTGYKGPQAVPFSASLWFKKDGHTPVTYPYMISSGQTNGVDVFSMYIHDAWPGRVVTNVGSDYLLGTNRVDDNVWHLATFTIDANNLGSLYIDGVFDVSMTMASAFSNAGNDFKIGTPVFSDDPITFFQGSLDNIRIYRRALTQDDITTIYNTEKP